VETFQQKANQLFKVDQNCVRLKIKKARKYAMLFTQRIRLLKKRLARSKDLAMTVIANVVKQSLFLK